MNGKDKEVIKEKANNEPLSSKEHGDQLDTQKLQIGFWNIRGIVRKTREFYDYIRTFDCIGLVETWLEEGDEKWKNVKEHLSEEFNLKVVYARRRGTRGRAKGGIITGVKKYLQEEETPTEMENAQKRIIRVQGKRINILTVYVPGGDEDRENIWRILKDYSQESGIIVGGDFNARTGEKTPINCPRRRKSQDKMSNKAGRELLKILQEKEWTILNGGTTGDESGNFTFVGARGNSVIDYAIVNSPILLDVERFEVENRNLGESDHKPIKITLKFREECNTDKETEKLVSDFEKKLNFGEIFKSFYKNKYLQK